VLLFDTRNPLTALVCRLYVGSASEPASLDDGSLYCCFHASPCPHNAWGATHSSTWPSDGPTTLPNIKNAKPRLNLYWNILKPSSLPDSGIYRYVITSMLLASILITLTHWLTHSRSSALLEKLPIVQPRKKFPTFYVTLPYSQEPFTGSYPEQQQSNSYSKIHFNIVHPCTSWSSQWSLIFWLSHQYLTCISLPPLLKIS
jgi:hypothetical protein